MQLRIAVWAYFGVSRIGAAPALFLKPIVSFDENPTSQLFDLRSRQRTTAGVLVGGLDVLAYLALDALASARFEYRKALARAQTAFRRHVSAFRTSSAWSSTVTFGQT
jgi:hypothetical protein